MTREPLPAGLKFSRTEPRSWNGYGFGTDSAKWIATYNGEEVGSWFSPSSGSMQITIMGKRRMTLSHRVWRSEVIKAVKEITD